MKDLVRYSGCKLASMVEGETPYGFLENAEIVACEDRVLWSGSSDDLPDTYASLKTTHLGGKLVTPALIDCHTHLVHGGNRAREFELRLQGATYEEISRAGGGINATVTATRRASDTQLLEETLKRVDALMHEGVSVFEIKSGYGLTVNDEMRMLRIARQVAARRDIVVKTTWLAAHAIPPEYEGRADGYIDEVAIAGLIQAHAEGLVDAVDAFCEPIAFTREQVDRLFQVAKELGLPVKLHAEQLTDQKGALLAAEYNGLSADHLEYLSEGDVESFAASGAVAVLLPGAFYTLKETKLPPVEALRAHNVPIAVATDCNPGSSPITSILTILNMACTLFGLTPEEALTGVTRNAAKALGLEGQYGVVAPNAHAVFAVWDCEHPSELSYGMGRSPLTGIISHRKHA